MTKAAKKPGKPIVARRGKVSIYNTTGYGAASPTRAPANQNSGGNPGEKDVFRDTTAIADAIKDLPQAPVSELTPDRIQFSIRLRFNPIRDLTPERLTGYLDSFRLGFFRNAALAWDAMERRDTRLQTVAPKRKKSVSRHGWEVLAVDDSPEAAAQKDFLNSFWNNVSCTTAMEPDEQGGMTLLLRQMMDCVGKRYAVHEIVWQPQADGTLTAKFIFCPLWWFEGTRGKLRFLLSEFAIYGADMDDGGWMVTVGDGIMEACSVAYIFKHLPLRDWLNFSEKFGMPGILGRTDAAIDSPEWNAFVAAVQNFGTDWAAVANLTNQIDLVEAKNTGAQPFQPLVERMDEEMTRLWRGSDLGTSSKHNATGASLQGDEGEILEVDDAAMLSETLTLKVCRYALAWKFGPDTPQLAYIKIKTSEKKNLELDLKIDDFLLKAAFPIDQASAGERYSRAIPDANAALLVASAAPDLTPNADPETDIANARKPAKASAAFLAKAKADLAAATADDLSHVLGRLNEILQITDDALFLKKLQEFAADFPAFKKDILRDPAAARALQPILAASLANGIAAESKP